MEQTTSLLDLRQAPPAPPAPAATPYRLEFAYVAPSVRRQRVANLALTLAPLALAAGWAVTLRPQGIGGPAAYVMVRGTSMEPKYHSGDLVIVHRQPTYSLGDVIAYRIPQGDLGAGMVVIHRIVGGSASKGFVTQGINNPKPDDWHPKPSDVEGKAWLLVARGGQILLFLRSPATLASLAASIAVVMIVDPGGKRRRPDRRRTRGPSPEDPSEDPEPGGR